MNRFLRDNGFGVALLIGVALLVLAVLNGNPLAATIGFVLVVIGVAARPLEQLGVGRRGVDLKWQQETFTEIEQRVSDRLVRVSDSAKASDVAEVTVTSGPSVKANAEPAVGYGHANAATTITRVESPQEFAETIVAKVIEPTWRIDNQLVSMRSNITALIPPEWTFFGPIRRKDRSWTVGVRHSGTGDTIEGSDPDLVGAFRQLAASIENAGLKRS